MAVEILDAPSGQHLPARGASLSSQQLPDPAEVATVVINGRRFVGWKSVFVQVRWMDPHPVFQFEVAESDPEPNFARLQFMAGDQVTIYLGGQLAVTGYILRRQTAYDAGRHGVQFFGVGSTWFAARGSIIDKTNNFDNMTLEQAAAKVIAPFGVGLKVVGEISQIPFKNLSAEPGQTVWEFLERAAREKEAIIGSDHQGNFLLIGDHNNPVVWDLVEGLNIKHCECTMSIEGSRTDFRVWGQTPADDEKNGADAAHQEASAPGMAMPYSPILIPIENPVWTPAEVAKRAQFEAKVALGTYCTAVITVQGWMRGPALWRAGDKVNVNSPMAMLYNETMVINCATFTQDSESGTNTSLELVMPQKLLDAPNLSPGRETWSGKALAGKGEASTTHAVEQPAETKPPDAAPEVLPPVNAVQPHAFAGNFRLGK